LGRPARDSHGEEALPSVPCRRGLEIAWNRNPRRLGGGGKKGEEEEAARRLGEEAMANGGAAQKPKGRGDEAFLLSFSLWRINLFYYRGGKRTDRFAE